MADPRPDLVKLVPIDSGLFVDWMNNPYAPLDGYLNLTDNVTKIISQIDLTPDEVADEKYIITGLVNGREYTVQYVQIMDDPDGIQYYSDSLVGIPSGKPAAPTLSSVVANSTQTKLIASVIMPNNNGGALNEIDFVIYDVEAQEYLDPPSKTSLSNPVAGTKLSFELALEGGQTLVTGKAYVVACLVRNAAGNSPLSNSIEQTLAVSYPPNAPTVNSVTSGLDGELVVKFTPGAQREDYPDIYYYVYYWDMNANPDVDPETGSVQVLVPDPALPSYTKTLGGLDNAMGYTIKVKAFNEWADDDESDFSNAMTGLPYIPASFSANPISLTPSGLSMTATWQAANGTFAYAPAGTPPVLVNSYTYSLTAPGQSDITGDATDANRSAQFNNLVSGVTYTFSVTAIQTIPPNLAAFTIPRVNVSTANASSQANLSIVPSAPRSVTALPDTLSTEQIKWVQPSNNGGATISYYYVEAWTVPIPSSFVPTSRGTPGVILPSYDSVELNLAAQQWVTSTAGFSTIVDGLQQNVAYYYRVFANNIAGLSVPSTLVGPNYISDGMPEVTDAALVIDTIEQGLLKLKVSWTSVTSTSDFTITGFDIYKVDAQGNYTYATNKPYVVDQASQAYSALISVAAAPNERYQFAIQTMGTYLANPDKSAFVLTNQVTTATAPVISSFQISPAGVVTFLLNANGSQILPNGIMLFAPAGESYSGDEPDPVNFIPVKMSTGLESYSFQIPYTVASANQPYLISASNAVGVDYDYANLN